MSTLPDYTPVIATYERPAALARALESLAAQRHAPREVIVVDASGPESAAANRQASEAMAGRMAVSYQEARTPGASAQRNQGLLAVKTPLVAFLDDDAEARPETFAVLAGCFAADTAGTLLGAGGRMEPGGSAPPPSALVRAYYRLQAGYDHPHYGGRVFGPGLCTFPCWAAEAGDEIETQWLSSCCVLYRTEAVRALGFPEFPGYSACEDLYLSAQLARTGRLVARRDAPFDHADESSVFKRDRAGIVRRQFRNQRRVAREVQGRSAAAVAWGQFLHRLFLSATLVKARGPGWADALRGVWT